jgi:hypothetical protein
MSNLQLKNLHRFYDGEVLFYKRLRKGRFYKWIFWNRKKHRLVSLHSLTEIQPPRGESLGGIREIPIEKIIGSEDRANDFIGEFYPLKRWMMNRWVSVLIYMQKNPAFEAIKVIEYGGYYFVRDGHHRVSVAMARGIQFMSAEVLTYTTAVYLPPRFNRTMMDIFREKVALQSNTGLFDNIEDDPFDVRRKGTWTWIGREIFDYNHSWFVRKNGREPHNDKELVDGWRKNIYHTAIELIKENSLHYLFPRWGSTDIFVDFIKFWNSFSNPDSQWLEEVYRRYSMKVQKKRFLLTGLQIGAKWIKSFSDTEESLLRRFKMATQMDDLISDFQLPGRSRRLIRFLYNQVYFHYAIYLKRKLKRAPYIQELTLHWYKNFLCSPLPSL